MGEEKKVINGGDVLIKTFLNEGIKYLFGIPGGQFLTMYDAIYRWGKEQGIETVLFRHEQAAAHAADAYTRVTNKPGICFGTVGPGAMNLVPGVGTAWRDNIPIIALVPQVGSEFEDSYTLQGNLDQITMFKPITKYQKTVRKIKDIPDAVQKVFREINGGSPKPVLLEIFEDALVGEIEENELEILPPEKYRPMSKPAIESEMIDKALDLLITAKKPLIISGGGVSRSEGWSELQELVEYLKIPVITSLMGTGTISKRSECFMGSSIGCSSALQITGDSDVILALGTKFTYSLGHGQPPFFKNDQTLIQVDIDPNIIGRSKPVTLGIVGDTRQFLKQTLEKVKQMDKVQNREWLNECKNIRENYIKKMNKKASKDKIPILPERLVGDVFKFMEEDAIFIGDGGDISCYVVEQLNMHKERKPLSYLQPVGMGMLGVAVPYCIGAKLGKPDKQVIAIAGDGSFMINIQDLETAVRLKLNNLIIVIANNNAWGMIKSGQKLFMGKRYLDVDLPDFDYARCAEGFGCYGEVVTDPNEIIPALERAKSSGKPAVLDVKIKFDTPDSTKLMGSMGIL
ncbi:MAG: thiamine pyrophosphate-binding protein [Candidatus Lokiarchaeota archaeon]